MSWFLKPNSSKTARPILMIFFLCSFVVFHTSKWQNKTTPKCLQIIHFNQLHTIPSFISEYDVFVYIYLTFISESIIQIVQENSWFPWDQSSSSQSADVHSWTQVFPSVCNHTLSSGFLIQPLPATRFISSVQRAGARGSPHTTLTLTRVQ